MPDARSFPCPTCKHELQVDPRMVEGVLACPSCGSHVAVPRRDLPSEGDASKNPPSDAVQEGTTKVGTMASWRTEAGAEPDSFLPDIKIKAAAPSEMLAVAALVLPLVVQCVLFLGVVESETIGKVLSWGTVFVTALLLAIDAYHLGPIDVQGRERGGTIPLFFGMLLLWLVFYPLAYFRRRHFGRPNIGPLAIVVALIFVASPFAKEMFPIGRLGEGLFHQPAKDDEPPACDSPDVKVLLNDLIRKGPLKDGVRSIGGHREVKHDRVAKTRRGRCLVQVDQHRVTVTYEVSWIDVKRRAFQVRTVEPEDDPRGYFGIQMERQPADLAANEGGVLVKEAIAGLPAADAGIQAGDIIVKVNNQGFRRQDAMLHMQQVVIDLEPGVEVPVEVLRDGQRRQIRVTVGARPLHLP